MKFLKRLLLISILSTTLSSCGTVLGPVESDVNVQAISDVSTPHTLHVSLSKEMFKEDSTVFNKELALYTLGASLATDTKEQITQFYKNCKFDHIELSESYNVEPTTTSIGYAFAHINLDGIELVSATIRSAGYKREWADNVNLGLSGEHTGFALRADTVYDALESYMNKNNFISEKTKLLVGGYSRGAGVVNLLGKRIDDKNKLGKLENIYIYGIATPQGATEKGNYKNIFNVISRGDLISAIAPTQYGFTRYGQDIDVYTSKLDELMQEFDPDYNFPQFNDKIRSLAKDDASLVKYIIDGMVNYEATSEGDPLPVHTREDFYNNYQDTISYLMSIIFGLKDETFARIINRFGNLSLGEVLVLISEDGLYEFLKPYIDEDNIEYDSEYLKESLNKIIRFLLGPGVVVANVLLLGSTSSLMRMMNQHYGEVYYVILKDMIKNNN